MNETAKPIISRHLTAREIGLVRHIFGDSINYTTPLIYKQRYLPFQVSRTAVTPNGNIYFAPEAFKEDFSLFTADLVWIIHELTHVWQWQQGMLVKFRRVLFSEYNYGKLTGKEDFFGYGIEQQAAIVEDYARLKLGMTRLYGEGALDAYWHVIPFLPKPKKAPSRPSRHR